VNESGQTQAGAGGAALHGPAFVLAQTTPDTVILTGVKRPLKAFLADGAASTYTLRLLDLR